MDWQYLVYTSDTLLTTPISLVLVKENFSALFPTDNKVNIFEAVIYPNLLCHKYSRIPFHKRYFFWFILLILILILKYVLSIFYSFKFFVFYLYIVLTLLVLSIFHSFLVFHFYWYSTNITNIIFKNFTYIFATFINK